MSTAFGSVELRTNRKSSDLSSSLTRAWRDSPLAPAAFAGDEADGGGAEDEEAPPLEAGMPEASPAGDDLEPSAAGAPDFAAATLNRPRRPLEALAAAAAANVGYSAALVASSETDGEAAAADAVGDGVAVDAALGNTLPICAACCAAVGTVGAGGLGGAALAA